MKPSKYHVAHGSAARVLEPCDLRPPLQLAYELRYQARAMDLPLVDDGRAYVVHPPAGVAALDEATGGVIWRYKVGTPQLIHRGRLIVAGPSGMVEVLDPETGACERVIKQPCAVELVVVGDRLVARTSDDEGYLLYGFDFESGQRVWSWRPPSGVSIACVFGATETAVCFGLSKGPVAALDPTNGCELWRSSIADLTYSDLGTQRPGKVQGVAIIHDGRVLFEAHRWGVVAFSVKDGTRLWAQPVPGGPSACSLYEGRYYVLSTRGQFLVIDPATGKVRSEMPLVGKVSKKETVQPRSPLLISSTHVFTGSHEGYVLAFERETGKYVWGHRAKGGGSIGGYFASANGRLYYLDAAFRMYCLAQEA